MVPLELRDALLRLVVATAIGAVIGINRDLKHKPAGLRTHALVSLAAAFIVEIALSLPARDIGDAGASASRVMQGAITGIGFLGAGVILRARDQEQVHGLTTAASIWLAAGLGMGAGAGSWVPLLVAVGLAMTVLLVGGAIERFFHRLFDSGPPPAA